MKPSNHVNARIWEPVQPNDRINRYEDPLEQALEASHLGEISGEGCQTTDDGEIQFVDIDMELVNMDNALELVKTILEEAGVPAGSELRYEMDGEEVITPVGILEGVAIYLDGESLPDYAYLECDLDELRDIINDELSSGLGEVRGSWAGLTETALYIYGSSADMIFSALQPVFERYPLCWNARVVIRYGNPSLNPQTVLIPRHDEPFKDMT